MDEDEEFLVRSCTGFVDPEPKASQTLSAATVKTSLTRPVAPSMKVKKVSLQEGQSAEEAGGADAPAGDGAGEGDGQPYFGQFEIPAGLEDDEDQAPCTHKLPDGKCEPRGCQDIELSPQAGLVLVLFAFIPAVASVIYWLREPSNGLEGLFEKYKFPEEL